jgi:peptidyl-prolyl cis-trans isomerase C
VKFWTVSLLFAAWIVLAPQVANADDPVIARVGDVEIKQSDLDLAASEVGSELANIPQGERRRVLLQYLLENVLMARAAEEAKLTETPEFERRLDYYRRKAARDAYYDATVRNAISENLAKTLYEDRIKGMPTEEEIHARHILVETEDEAKQIAEELKKGTDFATLANEKSKDPGTEGGDLGFVGKGQLVKPFEDAAFALEVGAISEPVQSQFGWHIIKLEERRDRPPPAFDDVKDRIMASLVQQKAQEVLNQLSQAAKVEIVDEEIKQAVEEAGQRQLQQQLQMQQMIEEQQKQQGGAPDGGGANTEGGPEGVPQEQSE